MAALPSPHPLIIGRERELTILRERLGAALAGHGSVVLIGGEAGIGKTALAETLCWEAMEQGALILIGRSFDRTETPAYGPWLYLFERYQPANPLPAHPAAFAEHGFVGAVPSQAALFRQVLDFLSTVTASRPVILLLDDLQWSDPASLDLVRLIAQSVATLPLLILVTYRSDEVTSRHPLAMLLPLLVREANAARIDLHPFDVANVQTMVAQRYALPDAPKSRLVGYLHARTEGNPFFLGELLRTLEEERVLRTDDGVEWRLGDVTQVRVPPLLRQVIDGRVARLDEESQRLLTVAAVIGQEAPLDVWAVAGDVDETMLLTVVEHALDARLLVEMPDGQQVQFAHALVREALYEGLPSIRRRRLHRAVGEVLAAGRSPNPDAVAHHFQRANDERALPWLRTAGEQAQAAYAWLTAATRFEAALLLMARADGPAMERGWLAVRVSGLIRFVDVARARAFAEQAVTLARAADDRALVAFARLQCGVLACFAGDVARGVPEVEAASNGLAALSEAERAHLLAHSPGIGPASKMADARGPAVMWRAYVGPFPEVRALGERLVPEAEAGNEVVKQTLNEGIWGLAMAYALLGMPDEAAAMFAIAQGALLRADHHAVASLTMWLELEMVALPYRAEDIAGRRRLAERSEAEWTQASGVISDDIPRRFVRLSLLVLEGDWEEAERIASAVSGEERGLIHYRMMARRHLATVARLRGDAERAWRAVREVLPAGSATQPATIWPFDVVTAVQRIAAALALDDGDLPSARAWLDAHDRWMASSGAVLGLAEGRMLWGVYYRQVGDAARARRFAERALGHATDPHQPLALLAAHRLLGELATDVGRFDDAAMHLDAALVLADACATPYERALTLLARATLCIAIGRKDDAQECLADARSICEPLGARPALVQADALATRLAAITAAPPVYPAGLSAREVEVLRLLASGKTNRDIAAALFLSEHTVHAHVNHIYTKTETDNRAAATAFALRHSLA